MTLVQAVIIKTTTYSILYALEFGNDYQPDKTYYNKDFTKNLYTSLYSNEYDCMSVMNLACGL